MDLSPFPRLSLVESVSRMMDEYDIDGIYLDTTTNPFDCQNERHGCGYRDADGQRRSVYPISAVRQTFRRLYTVIKARKPDGLVDAHVWDCVNGAALAFATNYWNGEQLGRADFLPDGLPLDRFRAEFMGVNWGVPADFLNYSLGDFNKCHALSLLHDVPMRPYDLTENALESSIHKLFARFGRKQAQFLPYWKNAGCVAVTPTDCYASLYRHPTNGVLAAVSNLSRNQADVELRFDLKNLSLPDQVTAEDAREGTPLKMVGNKLSVRLEAQGWTLIWIQPGVAETNRRSRIRPPEG